MADDSQVPATSQKKFPIILLIGCIAILCALVVVASAGGALFYFNTGAVPGLPTLAAFGSPLPPALGTLPSNIPIETFSVPTPPGVATNALPADVATLPAPALAPAVPAGVYVIALRTQPAPPRRREDIAFDVTFLNTTPSPQSFRVVVYVYRPDQNRSFGETPAGNLGVQVGTTEHRAFGVWRLTGPGGCEEIVARVGWLDDNRRITLFPKPGGQIFEQTMAVCP